MSDSMSNPDISLDIVKKRFRESASVLEQLTSRIDQLHSAEQMAEGSATLLAQAREAINNFVEQAAQLVESARELQDSAQAAVTEAAKVLQAEEFAGLRSELAAFQLTIDERLNKLQDDMSHLTAKASLTQRSLPARWTKRGTSTP